MSRTVIDVEPLVDPWPIIDGWAKDWRYVLKAHGPWGRRYQHGDGFAIAAVCVQCEPLAAGIRLSAWVPLVGRGMERDIHSGGFVGAVPRGLGRDHVNELLRKLELPPIGA